MKKWFFMFLLLALAISELAAQDWELFPREESLFSGDLDSLSPRSGYSIVGSRFFTHLLEGLRQDPANNLYAPIGSFTASSLSHTYEGGDYKFGAAPGSLHEFELWTEGISRNEQGWVFFGDLSITKSYQDDLRWNLSYQLPEEGLMEDPHYFGVSRAAPWSNQEYQLNGGTLLPLVAGRLHLLAKVDYRLLNKYRQDLDPRPKVNYNRLGFTGGLNYRLSGPHHLKLSASYSYTHVDNDIKFSNNDKNIPANHDLYVKWIAGYGYMVNPLENSTRRRYRSSGISLGYAYQGTDLTVLADLDYSESRQRTYTSNEVEQEDDPRGYFATYYPSSLRGAISILRSGEQGELWKLVLEGESYAADNFLQAKGGKTYAAKKEEAGMLLGYLKQTEDGSTDLELGLQAGFVRIYQKDALATTAMDSRRLQGEAYAQKQVFDREWLGIFPFASVGLSLPLQGSLYNGNAGYLENIGPSDFAGQALKAYYQELLLPDFELLDARSLSLQLGTNFRFDFKKRFHSLLRLQTGLQAPLEELEYFQQQDPLRFNTFVSFTIYY